MAVQSPRRLASRPQTRKQNQRREKKASTDNSSWRNEILAFALVIFALFLGVSIFLALPYNSVLDRNTLGLVGRGLGEWLYQTFGVAAMMIPVWLVAQSIRSWNLDESDGYPGSWLSVRSVFGLIITLVALCCLGYLINKTTFGGALGKTVAAPVRDSFGRWGASFLSVAFLLFSMPLGMGISVSKFLAQLVSAAKYLFFTAPVFLAIEFWSFVKIFIGESAAALKGKPKDKERTPVLPKPKVRRVNVAAEEEEEGEVEEESYSHVVVSRREKTENKKPKVLVKPVPVEKSEYIAPSIDLLTKGEPATGNEDDEELVELSRLIEVKLKDFSIAGRVTHVHPGPVITLFEFEPAAGVKVGRIAALQEDLAMSLKATSIRVIAPIPKRGTVGIEVPNKHRDLVRLRDVLENEHFAHTNALLNFPLGKDTYGDPVVVDIASMPHLLIAGTTGTGKSVCINALLLSLLYKCSPAELGLILIDPKILELSVYEGIPHLKVPVVTVPKQAKAVLDWAAKEMDRRYRLMQRFGVRNIDSYNKIVTGEVSPKAAQSLAESVVELEEDPVEISVAPTDEKPPLNGEVLEQLPKILIVIDELADLMLTVGRDIEELITRLAQKARASGIHLIIATQRPSVDVITGLIKANFPARISFRVSTRIDSRTILDSMGAEKLLGKGDMLFLQPGAHALRRVHGAFVSDDEVQKVVGAIKAKSAPCYDQQIVAVCERALKEEEDADENGTEGEFPGEHDPFYDKAVELVVSKGHASTSMIQRVFRIGYNRAARIIEMMEKEGVIGPMDGVRPREVLVQNHLNDSES